MALSPVPPSDTRHVTVADALGDLADGWEEGPDCNATTPEALTAAAALLENLTVVPTPSGGVQVEAHGGGLDLELEVDQDGRWVAVSWAVVP